jgi:lipopolysaccharide transport system ATP-binding protein
MSGDLRVAVRGLSKRYRLQADKARSARRRAGQWVQHLVRRPPPGSVPAGDDVFWALKDVSFEVRDGDRVGIIGRNGAGKTTLLKILSRVAYPTEGEARIRGRVTALLEVGTGFNPRLTGRDNIFLNSSLHGLSHREINAKFDEIVEFSGVGRFVDLPVNHYSSGMRMRLAFSIAAHLDPDILLLDEVLAVGDLAFQQKCLKRVEGLTSQGRTILFVSHGMGHIVRFCDRVIWLDHGRIRFNGDVATGVQLYQHEVLSQEGPGPGLQSFVERKGTGLARFTRVEVLDADLRPTDRVHTGQDIHIAIYYELREALPRRPWDVFVFCAVENDKKQRLFGLPSEVLPVDLTDLPAAGRFLCRVERLPLVPGIYDLTTSLLIDRELADKVVGAKKLVVFEGDYYGTGKLPIPSFGQVCTRFHWSVEPNDSATATASSRLSRSLTGS